MRRTLAIVAAILAVIGGVYLVGWNGGEDASERRELESEIETGRAIDEAPIFGVDDPSVDRELCRFAGREDCSDLLGDGSHPRGAR